MEAEQELEWVDAQKIGISEDLVAVAKRQLKFLAAVDRNRCLYEGPVLDRAIYRLITLSSESDYDYFFFFFGSCIIFLFLLCSLSG